MTDIIEGLTLPIVMFVIGALFFLVGILGNVELKWIVIKLTREQRRIITFFGVVLVPIIAYLCLHCLR